MYLPLEKGISKKYLYAIFIFCAQLSYALLASLDTIAQNDLIFHLNPVKSLKIHDLFLISTAQISATTGS